MENKVFCGVLVILLFCQPVLGQAITMDEFLQSVRLSHPFFAKESLSSEIELQARDRHLGSQDWSISSRKFYIHQEPSGTNSFSPEEIDMVGGDLVIEKAFWNTGGRLSFSWESDFTDQASPDMVISSPMGEIVFPMGPAKFYSNRAYLTYSQPLLQNLGGELDRLGYELSQYTVDLTEVQARENQEAFILELGDRFLDWTLLSEQRRIANERLGLAEEQLQQTRRKRAANLVDKVDVLRAEDAVRIANQSMVFIDSQWKAKQAELAVLSQSQELYSLDPEFDLHRLEALPSPDEAVARMKEESMILRILDIRHQQLAHLISGYEEAERPQLFLTVGAGLQGGDEGFVDALRLDKPDLMVSLDARYPLSNRAAKADVARTNLELKQIEKEIENVALNLESAIRNLLILIGEMEDVLALNQEQIESAEAKTREELRLYNQGRGILTFVIQSRDNEEAAKLNYAQNAASYHKLVLQYRALMDELLEQE